MKKIYLVSLLMMEIIVFSQEKSINIGVNYNTVFNNYKFYNPVIDKNDWETTYEYKSKYNYSTGISFEYIKNIYLGIDLNYTTKGYKLEYNFTPIVNDPVIPKSSIVEAGYIDVFGAVGYSLKLNDNLLLIPNIKLIYSGLINNKITTLSGDDKEYTSKNGEGILIKQELRKSIFSSGIGVNLKLNILKSVSIGIEPSLLYSFAKISDKAIETNTLFYTIKFGVYFKINKNEE